jgi:hypothetical protein
MENAHLLRYPHPSSLRRTMVYASFLGISEALYLGILHRSRRAAETGCGSKRFPVVGRAVLVRFFGMLLLAGLMAFSACATQPEVGRPARPAPASLPPRESVPPPGPEPSLPPESKAPVPSPKATEPAPPPSPRLAASRHLTEQARLLLESGKPDEAIRTLERAVNLSPANGLNFYYLSEAWLMKKDLRQAEEFNRLAGLYLKDDPVWAARVSQQAERIRKRRGK